MATGKVIGLGIILDLIDKVTGPAGRIARQFKETKATAVEMGTEMRNLGLGMTATGMAITYANAKIVGSTFDSQRALGELASLGIRDLGAIENKAEQVSNRWAGMAKSRFITAAYDIKSAISNLTDSAVADFTRWSSITAMATKGTAEQMGDLFATSYGIFKELYKNVSDSRFSEILSGVIATVVREFKMTGPKVGEYISLLGASATKQNVPLAEQMAIGGMLGATMSGSEAATKYSAFLKQPVKAADKLGLAFTDSNNRLLPMANILDNIRGKFGDYIDAVEKGQLMEAFGRIEGVKLVELLISKTNELRQKTQILQNVIGQGGRAALDMAKAINAPVGQKWIVFKQQFHNLVEIMGNALLPAAIDVIGVFSNMALKAQEFLKNHPRFARFAAVMMSLSGIALAVGGAFLTVGGTFLIAFHSLEKLFIVIEGIQFLFFSMKYYTVIGSTAIQLFFSAASKAVWAFMATNPVGWILLAISAIVMFALAWKNNWLGIGDFMNRVVANIALGFNWLKEKILLHIKWLITLPSKFYDAGKKIVMSLWNGIKSVASGPVKAIEGIIENIRAYLPFSPAKEGPFRTPPESFGKAITQGLAEGINKGKSHISNAMDSLFSNVPPVHMMRPIVVTVGEQAIYPLPNEVPSLKAFAGAKPLKDLFGFTSEAADAVSRNSKYKPIRWADLNNDYPSTSLPGKTSLGDATGDLGSSSSGGSGSMGSGNVYITQHFERGSVVLQADKLDDNKLRSLMGRIFQEEINK